MDLLAELFPNKITKIAPHKLYRLGETIHRVDPSPQAGLRNFVKITFSKQRYAQPENTRNYQLCYDWHGTDTSRDLQIRNCPNELTRKVNYGPTEEV